MKPRMAFFAAQSAVACLSWNWEETASVYGLVLHVVLHPSLRRCIPRIQPISWPLAINRCVLRSGSGRARPTGVLQPCLAHTGLSGGHAGLCTAAVNKDSTIYRVHTWIWHYCSKVCLAPLLDIPKMCRRRIEVYQHPRVQEEVAFNSVEMAQVF